MALSDYRDRNRADGYAGIRVTTCFNGKPRQHYFAPERASEAFALEARWQETLTGLGFACIAGHTSRRQADDWPTATGVVGLHVVVHPLKTDPRLFRYPAIRLCSHYRGTIATSRHVGRRRSITDGWHQVCAELAEHQGLARIPSRWLAAEPQPVQFFRVALAMIQSGLRVDVRDLAYLTQDAAKLDD